MKDFIETRIITAVRGLLTGRVNELLWSTELLVPVIEFEGNGDGYIITPLISLSTCERTEKERIVKLDSYSLSITFTVPESPDSELLSYVYAGAVCRAVYDNPTLGGVVNRAVISGKKYVPPKVHHCGEPWTVVILIRLSVEGLIE